jgi:hypothetical protein
MVEHRLGRSGRVPVDTARDQHGQHAIAPVDGVLDDAGIVGGSREESETPCERVEFGHACRSAYADDLITPIQRMLHQVLPELAGGPDDANLLPGRAVGALVASCSMSSFTSSLESLRPAAGAVAVRQTSRASASASSREPLFSEPVSDLAASRYPA